MHKLIHVKIGPGGPPADHLCMLEWSSVVMDVPLPPHSQVGSLPRVGNICMVFAGVVREGLSCKRGRNLILRLSKVMIMSGIYVWSLLE